MKTETLMRRSLRTGHQLWLWRDRDMKIHATFYARKQGACFIGRIVGREFSS